MSEHKITTRAVTEKKQHKGWKVYIDGEKFPKKPVDFYAGMTEEQAVTNVVQEYQKQKDKGVVSTSFTGTLPNNENPWPLKDEAA